MPARPAILAGTVIDFGSQKVYSGSTEPFVAGGAVHKNVAVRPTPGSRSLASAARTSRADGSRVAFEVGSASLTFPDGHVNARGAVDWLQTLVSNAKLPCAFVETAEHDPRVIAARKVEKTLQDKGLTSTHMDFSKSIHATHTLSSSVTFQSESPGGGFEASAQFTLTDAKSGASLGSKSVSGHFDSLEAFDQAMQDALNELLSAACKPPSYRYEVLDANLTTHAKGTPGPDLCSQFGDLTTTIRFPYRPL